MRGLVQRVARAEVRVDDRTVGAIGPGMLVLVGAGEGDTAAEADWLAGKLARLRIFEDDQGRMNRSVVDIGGEVLVVSQFTLFADASRGNRPSFITAAQPAVAEPLVERVADGLRSAGLVVATGQFGAHMAVELVNDGPVTLMLERPPGAASPAPASAD
jgi:D-tyrosyl-tRNA(Tyr) deacylase